METIKTERLILRAFTPGDLDDLYEYASNENVGPPAGWKPHESKEESAATLKDFIKDNEIWAIEYAENKKVIGAIGFQKDCMRNFDESKELGYALSEEYWGRGIMSEAGRSLIDYAFSKLDISIISCTHFPFNERSKSTIKKLGFTYEGTLKKAYKIYNNKIYDLAVYSLTREDWLER